MQSLILSPHDTATLLLLNVAVLNVIEGDRSEDVIDELKTLQSELEQILYKDGSPVFQMRENVREFERSFRKWILKHEMNLKINL